MACSETGKYLYEFMDKELDTPRHSAIKNHLDYCAECRRRHEFEKGLRALIKASCMNVSPPAHLQLRIIEGINSIDMNAASRRDKSADSRQNTPRFSFSLRMYAAAASILLFVTGGVFYLSQYPTNDSTSIVDSAVENHVVAVKDNLVFNEETSVVGNAKKYFSNSITTSPFTASPVSNAEQTRVIGGLPVRLSGTSSPCVIFDMGGNKLSLQVMHQNSFPVKNLEKTRMGPREFYVGNCRGFNSVLWKEGDSVYCLTSDINKNDMLRFAATLTSR